MDAEGSGPAAQERALLAEIARLRQRRAEAEQRVARPVARAARVPDAGLLRSILASSGDCIKVLDLDVNLVFMSEGGQRVMEVGDSNAIRGCPWLDFWRDQSKADARAAVDAAKAGGTGRFQGAASTMDGRDAPVLGRTGHPYPGRGWAAGDAAVRVARHHRRT